MKTSWTMKITIMPPWTMILWLDFTIVALHTFPVEVAIIRKIKTVYTTPTQKLYFIELSLSPHAIIHITSWLCYNLHVDCAASLQAFSCTCIIQCICESSIFLSLAIHTWPLRIFTTWQFTLLLSFILITLCFHICSRSVVNQTSLTDCKRYSVC